jgi:hypothetical protein
MLSRFAIKKTNNDEKTCPYKTKKTRCSPQHYQSLSSRHVLENVKHGLGSLIFALFGSLTAGETWIAGADRAKLPRRLVNVQYGEPSAATGQRRPFFHPS